MRICDSWTAAGQGGTEWCQADEANYSATRQPPPPVPTATQTSTKSKHLPDTPLQQSMKTRLE